LVSKTVDRPFEAVWTFTTSPAGVAIRPVEGVTVLSKRGAGDETMAEVRGETRSFASSTVSGSLGSRPTGHTTRRCSWS